MKHTQSKMQGRTSLFVHTLLTSPQLGIACLKEHVLKELHSISPEAKRWCAGMITGLTVDLDKPLNELYVSELVSMLSKGHLLRLCLVLYPKQYGEFSDHDRMGDACYSWLPSREMTCS